jgi:hypothetical protein
VLGRMPRDGVRAPSPSPAERDVVPARYLRVVTFQPHGHEASVDAALRDRFLPALLARAAVVDAWIGRHGTRTDHMRVIASTWSAPPGDAPPDVVFLTALEASTAAGLSIDREQTLELSVHSRFERSDPARILRLFRGRVREGELDAYVGDARSGMLADAMVNDGLIAFALGADPPDAFVTVSVWTGWSAIEEATGGNTRQPIATRNSIRLTGFDVVHFEVLPDASDRRSGDAAAGAPAVGGEAAAGS